MKAPTGTDFALVVNFPPGAENPSRIFEAITELIEAFSSFDAELIKSVDVNLQPVLVLENIESGSIRIWFRNLIKSLDDDGLKNLDWKPLVGQYLVKGKYKIVKALEQPEPPNRKRLVVLRDDLQELAEGTATNKLLPMVSPVELPKLITGMRQVSSALARLGPGETAHYETADGEGASFNPGFRLSEEDFEELLTAQTLTNSTPMILKVKKPDYLGSSMWEFRYEGRSMPARIEDVEWLRKFQERQVDVRPGDAIKATVRVEVKYGFDGEVVATHHIIEKVDDVLRYNPKQDGLFPTGS